eukprot:CAMPEP_0116132866 /NCGR_PEP_ID=MMETSP0329-20121206/9787_1 /TAXON_ID=697910 /ORGANISM="Pseudo-nitzschia arenysensis, Strain B593" /LENGTH=205 /DNA_ID=CAMNT_0003627431 /DNA_START=362 /DNA_END=979 /DNA_ORIENTATION=+
MSQRIRAPYHRIIDPTVDLLEVHKTHSNLPWLSKFGYALIDKSPKEFILRGSGTIQSDFLQEYDKEETGTLLIVDRACCLQVDPIRIHSNSFQLEFDSSIIKNIGFDLLIKGCSGTNLVEENCHEISLRKGQGIQLPPMRTISIGIDSKVDLGKTTCSESHREDIVLKLTNVRTFDAARLEQPPQQQQRNSDNDNDKNDDNHIAI